MILSRKKTRTVCYLYNKSIIDLGHRVFLGLLLAILAPKESRIAGKILKVCHSYLGGCLHTENYDDWYNDVVFAGAIFGKNIKFVDFFDPFYLDCKDNDSHT